MPNLPSRLGEEVSKTFQWELEDPSCQGRSLQRCQTALPGFLESVPLSTMGPQVVLQSDRSPLHYSLHSSSFSPTSFWISLLHRKNRKQDRQRQQEQKMSSS